MEKDKDLLFQMKDHKVKMLRHEEDIEDVLRLCQNCLDYYALEGIKSVDIQNAKEIFEGLPQGKTSEDKMVIGIYGEKDNLIGIIEGIREFPQKDIWYVGLMMIAKEKRNEGLGEKFYKAFEKWSSEHDVNSIRLGVLEENAMGLGFWKKVGFNVIKKIDNFKIGNIETTVFSMENNLF
ncbi:GNAT family N-acetyltransferase [Wukongibacter baidiensis]|uniref:GNAT family N-acetyltransferase n=1 Tax=Wukongibacter baidiensis TaxID=1723361 RepID=UPI003D7F6EE5